MLGWAHCEQESSMWLTSPFCLALCLSFTTGPGPDEHARPRVTINPTMTALTNLQRLEAESIDIMREAVAEGEKPVMLYSIGKDSSVMLHLAMKAFYPSKPPF